MLKQRIVTASILIPVTLLVLFFLPPWAFAIVTALITLQGAWEWTHLMQIKNVPAKLFYVFIVLLGIFASMMPIPLLPITGIWWLIAALLVMLYPRASTWWTKGYLVRGVMGLLVLVPCWAALNYMRDLNLGSYLLLFLFVLIWGADAGAYFVGKRWGSIKLAPQVSPGKSVQGLIGALVFGVVFTLMVAWFCQYPRQAVLGFVSVSIVTVLFSVIGDLFESALKRNAGIKDSSSLLPGHGGLLDRIDSLTAAAPIFLLSLIGT